MTSPASSICPYCREYHGSTNGEIDCRDREIAKRDAEIARLTQRVQWLYDREAAMSLAGRGRG